MLKDLLRVSATAAALCLFVTPVQTALQISRDRSVGALSPVPFAAISLNGAIWMLYGTILRNWVPLVASNGVGMLCGLYCLTTYSRYSKSGTRVLAMQLRAGVLLALGLLGAVTHGALARGVDPAAAAALAADGAPVGTADDRAVAADDAATLRSVGYLGCCVCVIMFASPLSSFARVVRARSTASLVPSVTAASLACSALWTAYGRLEGDVFLWGPNAAGFACSLLQVALFVRYGVHRPPVVVPSHVTDEFSHIAADHDEY